MMLLAAKLLMGAVQPFKVNMGTLYLTADGYQGASFARLRLFPDGTYIIQRADRNISNKTTVTVTLNFRWFDIDPQTIGFTPVVKMTQISSGGDNPGKSIGGQYGTQLVLDQERVWSVQVHSPPTSNYSPTSYILNCRLEFYDPADLINPIHSANVVFSVTSYGLSSVN